MLITEILDKNADLYGNELALIEINPEFEEPINNWRDLELVASAHRSGYRREMSWRAFWLKSNRFANLLLSDGLQKGDKVGILLMNCIEWLPVYFGVLKAGAIVVPLNFRYSPDEIEYCLKLADVTRLVFGSDFTERINTIQDKIPFVKTMYYLGGDTPPYAENYELKTDQAQDTQPYSEISTTDHAAIYFSSGTTGFPKAILHSHEALYFSCKVEQNHHGQQKNDVFLCIPPLYHTGAKMHWFGSFLVGATSVLLRGVKPKWIIETLARERATIVWLLVPWAQDILDCIDSGDIVLEDYELTRLRLMHIGAQPVPPGLIKRWLKIFPDHEYDTNYGLSESIGPGAVHLGVDNIAKVGSIGKAGYGWETRIVDEQGMDVPRGAVGELLLKGKGVMKEYYKDTEATAATLKDNWLYTGDMAREDSDGFIFLVDRKKDLIITGGENIYPVQIEDFLRGYEKIRDVAVIGEAHPRLGEVAIAIIDTKEECTVDEIFEFCLALPRYKRPRRVVFDTIPRNPTGKIEKPVLREKYAGGSIVAKQIEG